MSQFDLELAAVCQSIAEDGILTEHEVRFLAEWLSANPSARETTIGKKLTEALNEILADGVIDEEELHRLAPLIGEAISSQFAVVPMESEVLPPAISEVQTSPKGKGGLVAGVKNWLARRKEKRQQEEFARYEMNRRRILQRQNYIQDITRGLQNGNGFLESASSFVSNANERICWIEPSVLHEMKVVGRRYVGGSHSTRIRIAKGLSFSVGGSRGQAVSERGIVPTSRGNLVITTKRLAFVGDMKSVALKLEKLIDVQITLDGIQFSESGKEHPRLIRFNHSNGDIVLAVVNFVLNPA